MALKTRHILVAACAIFIHVACARAQTNVPAPIHLQILGGHGGLNQYLRYESPFWIQNVPELTNGRLKPRIAPFDESGFGAQELLPLIKLGVIPIATIPIALASSDDPELGILDLPFANPDIEALRQTVAHWRPHLTRIIADRYNGELLAVYTHSAQVMFCTKEFVGLSDLSERRIRTSSVAQSELVLSLRGIPIVVPFARIIEAVQQKLVDCVITGTSAGNQIGLHRLTTHISPFPVSWLVSIAVANRTVWAAMPKPVQEQVGQGLRRLETAIWDNAQHSTNDGLACNLGQSSCKEGQRGRMTLVPEQVRGHERRMGVLYDTMLRGWLDRCGQDCAEALRHITSSQAEIAAGER